MSHRPPHLNAHRRRARKQRLAARDGAQCYYCRRPFRELREATVDHIAPVSLWRSWSVSSLVLACRPCNDAKADRFPLSLALVLLAWVHPTRPVVRSVDLPLLARLAHAQETAFTSVTTRVTPGVTPRLAAVGAADSTGAWSTPHLHESTPHRPVQRAVRPDCLRAPRPVRACAGPTGEAVSA
ncbi:HNH endonuclease [Streptomyces azureus]|uniref:HNH endonuclease n=1 Tax=Streptomyces azureus TaxID=146537 RepID=A0A0K8PSK5_STRAJ|nr:HNH endonuclease [Streptomyces azureus]GAP50836.1 HNH endonuclease [Streptomyces azureus]